MEAGTNLISLGQPVANVVRIRPVLPNETRSGDLRVTDGQKKIVLIEPGKLQGTPEDEYSVDHCFVDNGFDEIYERSLVPLILRDETGFPGFMDGVNCTVLAFGNDNAGKTFTVEGSGPAAKDGVIPSVIAGIYEAIREKLADAQRGSKKSKGWRHKLSLQYIELVDEKINDLLNPLKIELDVDEMGINEGLGIRNLTRKWVDTEDELYHHFRVGQASRTSFRTEFGPMSERAVSIFAVELHQVVSRVQQGSKVPVEEHLFSRFCIIDTPGADKVAEDPTTLRIREGPTLNNSIIAFGQLVRTLAQSSDIRNSDLIDFKQSKFTALLQDILGGNARTLVVTTIPPADFKGNSFVLEFAQLFSRIRNFPVVNDGRAVALLRQYNNKLYLLQQQLLAAGFGGLDVDDRLTNHLLEIHSLEKKIIEDEKVRLALLEEREQLRDKIGQLNARMNQLLAEKGQLQQDRIISEEEKLKVSKVLVDLQIENTSLLEKAVDKEFQLENRMLQQENDIMELEMTSQAKQKRIEQLEKQHKADLDLIQDLKNELAAVRANYSSVLSDLDAEKSRCEELSVELLNLINTKNTLTREREQIQAQRDNLLKMTAELEKSLEAAERDLKEALARLEQMKIENSQLINTVERAKLELEAARLQFQEQKLAMERKFAAFEQMKNEEVLALRRELAERMAEHVTALSGTDGDLKETLIKYKKASRRVTELETELNDKAGIEEDINSENSELKTKMTQLSESYREKLHKYISDVSHLSSEVARGGGTEGSILAELRAAVDSMFQELVNTYGSRESQFLEELRRSREHNMNVIRKNRRLYQAYRSLRYQLEDLAPAGINVEVIDETSLQVDGDVGALEKQQSDLVHELRDKLAVAEAEAVSKSEKALRNAEKFTAQAADMQAKFSQQQNTITELKNRLAIAEEDKREKHNELRRLEQQLLQELSELKAKGVHTTQSVSGPSASDVSDLKRDLDRSQVENERLRSETQQLRNAATQKPPPPEAAPAANKPCQNCPSKDSTIEDLKAQLAAKSAELDKAKAEKAAAPPPAAKPTSAKAPPPSDDKGKDAEISKLQARVKELEDELAQDDYREMVKKFAQETQAELETQITQLKTENEMISAELTQLKSKK